jgi:hypothetical protein
VIRILLSASWAARHGVSLGNGPRRWEERWARPQDVSPGGGARTGRDRGRAARPG